jgi:hypothetical protein
MITQQDVVLLPLNEKIALMETLWAEISRIDEDVEVPEWHKEVLDERERRIRSGEAKFIPWEDAKRQIDEICR